MYDIFIKEKIKNTDIIEMTAQFFSINTQEILIVNDIEELLNYEVIDIKILFIIYPIIGDFAYKMDLYITDKSLSFNYEKFVKELSIKINIQCAMENLEELYSYTTIALFLPDGTKKIVKLKSQQLDNDEYYIDD